MARKQYSSLGQAIFDRLGNSGRKDPDTMFTHKKDPDPKPPFSKDHLRERFRKASSLCARCSKQPQLGCCGPATVQSFEI